MKKQITVLCGVSFSANLILFGIKLYVGLASNSISIYSDGINNFFDSISGLVALVCLGFIAKSSEKWAKGLLRRTEHLLSFLMSVMVAFAGIYFAYSSFERLMYPTPVNYNLKYLVLLTATAVAKLGLYFVFGYMSKKENSSVVKVMSVDSLLDFFVTAVTVLTLLLSSHGRYAVDAFCGIGISVMIIISSVKMIVTQVRKLVGYVPSDTRSQLESCILESENVKGIEDVYYIHGENEIIAIVKVKFKQGTDPVKSKTELSERLKEVPIKAEIII